MKKIILCLCLIVIAVGLAGCGRPELKGREFVYQGTPENITISLLFDKDDFRVSGRIGINRYSGSYKLEKKKNIAFSSLVSTKMAGTKDVMRIEAEYMMDMSQVVSFKIRKSTLTLITLHGKQLTFIEKK